MSASAPQGGFLLPMMVSLLLLFSGLWLTKQEQLSAADKMLNAAVELQQELLFWHRGVLHFYQKLGDWPSDLDAVANFFAVSQGSSHITGSPSSDGFKLQIVAIDTNLVERVIQPLREYFSIDTNGNYYLTLSVPSASTMNPHLIARQSAIQIILATTIDAAGYNLNSSELSATKGTITEVTSRQLHLHDALTAGYTAAAEVHANDVLVGGYSLVMQQQKLDSLYELLWHCLRVSKTCANESLQL